MELLESCASHDDPVRAKDDNFAVVEVFQNGSISQKLSSNFVVAVGVIVALRYVRLTNVKRIFVTVTDDWFYQ